MYKPTIDLIPDSITNRLGAMAGIGNEHAAGEIQPHISIGIMHLKTFSTVPDYRRLSTHGNGLHIAKCFQCDNRLGCGQSGRNAPVSGVNLRNLYWLDTKFLTHL